MLITCFPPTTVEERWSEACSVLQDGRHLLRSVRDGLASFVRLLLRRKMSADRLAHDLCPASRHELLGGVHVLAQDSTRTHLLVSRRCLPRVERILSTWHRHVRSSAGHLHVCVRTEAVQPVRGNHLCHAGRGTLHVRVAGDAGRDCLPRCRLQRSDLHNGVACGGTCPVL